MMSETNVWDLTVLSPDQMHELGIRIGNILEKGDLVVLNGELGAGKTTLTRGIGEGVKAKGNISSPTFLIARTHDTDSGISFNHMDAYRLSSPQELDDIDVDFRNSISVIEWGRGFTEGLVDSWLEIDIDRSLEDDVRQLRIVGFGKKFTNLKQLFGEPK